MSYTIILVDGFESQYISPSPLYAIDTHIVNNKRFIEIYLPDNYFETDNQYPVIYFLHGFGQNYSSYCSFLTLVDELIKQEKMPPVIVVKPDGMISGHLGSFYTNSELGKFEDYIRYELIPYIEQKYRVKKTKNNRALIGYGMGVCSALLYTFSIPFLFGSISYHLTECALVCPAIIEQTMHTKSLEQAKNRLSLRTFNIMNGPASFLFAAFEISQYTKILRDHLNRTPINSSIDQLIIESIDRDQLLQKGALQIKEMLQKKHIDPILLNTVINTNSLKKNFSCSLVPLFILWPSIKKAINTLPDTLEYNGFILQKEAAIALLSIGVDPTDYINQNSHFILAAEKNGIKADEIFADVPSAVLRLMVHSQHFSIEPDDEQERFKEALILHGLYFLNA